MCGGLVATRVSYRSSRVRTVVCSTCVRLNLFELEPRSKLNESALFELNFAKC